MHECTTDDGRVFHLVKYGPASWIIRRYIGAGNYSGEIFDAAGLALLVPTGRGSVWFNKINAIEFMEKHFGEEWNDHD